MKPDRLLTRKEAYFMAICCILGTVNCIVGIAAIVFYFAGKLCLC